MTFQVSSQFLQAVVTGSVTLSEIRCAAAQPVFGRNWNLPAQIYSLRGVFGEILLLRTEWNQYSMTLNIVQADLARSQVWVVPRFPAGMQFMGYVVYEPHTGRIIGRIDMRSTYIGPGNTCAVSFSEQLLTLHA